MKSKDHEIEEMQLEIKEKQKDKNEANEEIKVYLLLFFLIFVSSILPLACFSLQQFSLIVELRQQDSTVSFIHFVQNIKLRMKELEKGSHEKDEKMEELNEIHEELKVSDVTYYLVNPQFQTKLKAFPNVFHKRFDQALYH